MLKSVLDFFKTELINHLQFIGANHKSVGFPPFREGGQGAGELKMMMVNLEEETTMRRADVFTHEKNGKIYPGYPEIRLNLYLLFVADLSDYLTSMEMLSTLIRFFQAKRIFDRNNAPDLPTEIEKLSVELVTMPFGQQNEIWNALHTAYKPSVLYKVRMLVFSQDAPVQDHPLIKERIIQTSQ